MPSISSRLGISDGPLKVLYHSNSLDGFSAAFIIWQEKCSTKDISSIEFGGTDYGFVPHDIENKHVICLGFTYRKNSILSALEKSLSLTIIDNHIFDDSDIGENIKNNSKFRHIQIADKISSIVVWNMLFDEIEAPALLRYIQDRELWEFKMTNTREIIAALSSYSLDFSSWFQLFHTPIEELLKEGFIIRRYQTELTKAVVKNSTRINFMGYSRIPIVNCPWFIMSEVVGILSNNEQFAIGYFDTNNKRHFSLRSSVKSKVNVLKLAKAFGGGGHKNAAGFTANTHDNELLLGSLVNIPSKGGLK